MTSISYPVRGSLAVLAVAFTATVATAQSVVEQRKVDGDWFDFQIRWDESAPSYDSKWMLFNTGDGTILVCGAGAHRGGKHRANGKIMKNLGLFMGDDLLMADMSFFTQVKRSRDIVGARADCVSTGKNIRSYTSREVGLKDIGPMRRY